MDLPSFQHIAPSLRLFSGPECLKQLGRELDRVHSRRALLVSGSSLARSGALDLIRSALGERCAGLFTGVKAHSPLPSVEAAVEQLRSLDADAVVAVGGGSAIVTARAASILMVEQGDLKSLSTSLQPDGRLHSPKLMAAKLPQLIVPTTPTTAMVKVGSAVFDPVAGKRYALFDPKTRVQSIFIHPELIGSAPDELLVSAGLDTFSLALEGLASRSGDPISDALLMHSVRLLMANMAGPTPKSDPALRGELMVAAILAGLGTDHTGAGVATVLGHAIGARHEVENGVAKAVVLPHVVRFNAGAAEAGLAKIATAMEVPPNQRADAAERVIEKLGALSASLGLPTRLRDLGIGRDALAGIAELSMDDWFLRGNPRSVKDSSELRQILEEAW